MGLERARGRVAGGTAGYVHRSLHLRPAVLSSLRWSHIKANLSLWSSRLEKNIQVSLMNGGHDRRLALPSCSARRPGVRAKKSPGVRGMGGVMSTVLQLEVGCLFVRPVRKVLQECIRFGLRVEYDEGPGWVSKSFFIKGTREDVDRAKRVLQAELGFD